MFGSPAKAKKPASSRPLGQLGDIGNIKDTKAKNIDETSLKEDAVKGNRKRDRDSSVESTDEEHTSTEEQPRKKKANKKVRFNTDQSTANAPKEGPAKPDTPKRNTGNTEGASEKATPQGQTSGGTKSNTGDTPTQQRPYVSRVAGRYTPHPPFPSPGYSQKTMRDYWYEKKLAARKNMLRYRTQISR